MQELAIAAATVLSEVVIACDVVGKGGACALGAADINTTVTVRSNPSHHFSSQTLLRHDISCTSQCQTFTAELTHCLCVTGRKLKQLAG